MIGKIRSFRDLDVWQLGKEIALDVYQTTKEFPRDELYGLVSQMRRAAVPIPSNIAEGFNRHHNKDYRRFLLMAMGPCAELETQVEVSFDLKYISEAALKRLLERLDHESRMLRNLITRIENRKD
nr:predicted 23s rRNA protein [uncultured bacterium]